MSEYIIYPIINFLLLLTILPWVLIVAVPFVLMALGLGITVAAPFMLLKHRSPESQKIKVLLVDDSPNTLVLLKNILTNQSCVLKTVDSGKKAIEVLTHEKFDLMVLDYAMPDLNGAETIMLADKTLSESSLNGKATQMPVIEYTSNREDTIANVSTNFFTLVGKLNKDMPPSTLKPIISQILNDVVKYAA